MLAAEAKKAGIIIIIIIIIIITIIVTFININLKSGRT